MTATPPIPHDLTPLLTRLQYVREGSHYWLGCALGALEHEGADVVLLITIPRNRTDPVEVSLKPRKHTPPK